MANTTTCIAMSSLPTLISFRLIEIAAARLPPKTPFLGAGHTIARYSHTGYHVWSYQKCLGTIGAIVNLAGLLGRCWIEIGERSAFLLIQQIHKDCSCLQNLHKSSHTSTAYSTYWLIPFAQIRSSSQQMCLWKLVSICWYIFWGCSGHR